YRRERSSAPAAGTVHAGRWRARPRGPASAASRRPRFPPQRTGGTERDRSFPFPCRLRARMIVGQFERNERTRLFKADGPALHPLVGMVAGLPREEAELAGAIEAFQDRVDGGEVARVFRQIEPDRSQ